MNAKKVPMSQKIIDLTMKHPDWTPQQLAKELGCDVQYVYSTQYLHRKKVEGANPLAKKAESKVPAKRGRPKKAKFEAVAPMNTTTLHDLQTQTIRNLRKEIEELTVIIAYLEHRCAQAEARRGASV